MVQLSVNKSSQPNGTASATRGGMTEGCDAYRFPQNEASLVPILHNGLGSPTNRVCPPKIQLALVTKGIMDFHFDGEWRSWLTQRSDTPSFLSWVRVPPLQPCGIISKVRVPL